MGHLAFLFSVLLFCGPAILFVWKREERVLKRYELVLLIMIILSVVFVGPADYVAIHTLAWAYHPETSTNIYLLTLPEVYLFGIAVTVLVAMATLVLTYRIDRQHQRQLTRVGVHKKTAQRTQAKHVMKGQRAIIRRYHR